MAHHFFFLILEPTSDKNYYNLKIGYEHPFSVLFFNMFQIFDTLNTFILEIECKLPLHKVDLNNSNYFEFWIEETFNFGNTVLNLFYDFNRNVL